ncbi:hypothetical protein BDK51DRAFT_44344 [Blyttiomyces helicus]|uniref:Potassium channel domain-containing protein n=1 Tax=Blyttiomyces helicus TaxID=388810 RepID=A0A4P9WHB5_9FUNG|nr:hypothetical protein BDK51DRAFT_44344 [Blyttiomyces helicus]|eukprot:RKO92221.1 hypothetical protein BDK51DRAFT_44344 [Blyttiomyces helicus]
MIFSYYNSRLPQGEFVGQGLTAAQVSIYSGFFETIVMVMHCWLRAKTDTEPKTCSKLLLATTIAFKIGGWGLEGSQIGASACIERPPTFPPRFDCRYGNVTPVTLGGRIFLYFYVVVGLYIAGFFLITMQESMAERTDEMLRLRYERDQTRREQRAIKRRVAFERDLAARCPPPPLPGTPIANLPLESSTEVLSDPDQTSPGAPPQSAPEPAPRTLKWDPEIGSPPVKVNLSNADMAPSMMTGTESGDSTAFESSEATIKRNRRIKIFTMVLLIGWLGSSFVLTIVEPEWSYNDAVYFTFVTTTTM